MFAVINNAAAIENFFSKFISFVIIVLDTFQFVPLEILELKIVLVFDYFKCFYYLVIVNHV